MTSGDMLALKSAAGSDIDWRTLFFRLRVRGTEELLLGQFCLFDERYSGIPLILLVLVNRRRHCSTQTNMPFPQSLLHMMVIISCLNRLYY